MSQALIAPLAPITHYNAAERWFMAIRPGDTPESSTVASLTLEWINEWMALNTAEA